LECPLIGEHPCTGTADVAPQQQQVYQQTYGLTAMHLLREAHAIDRDHGLGLGVNVACRFHLGAGHTARFLQRKPACLSNFVAERLETIGVLGKK